MHALDDLIDYLTRTTRLNRPETERVIADVIDYFSETADAYVIRRHGELKSEQMANPLIFDRIAEELARRPVRAPQMSVRQIRRIIYG